MGQDSRNALAAAQWKLQQGRFPEAYDDLLSLSGHQISGTADYWTQLAWIAKKSGYELEAVSHYQTALEKNAGDVTALINLSIIFVDKHDLEVAVSYLDRLALLELEPHISQKVSELLLRLGEFERARKLLEEISTSVDFSVAARTNLASIYIRQGSYSAADRATQSALAVGHLTAMETNQLYSLSGMARLAQGDLRGATASYSCVAGHDYSSAPDSPMKTSWLRQREEQDAYRSTSIRPVARSEAAPSQSLCRRTDWQKIDEQLSSGQSSFIVLDDFLTADVAERMRDDLLRRAAWDPQSNDSELIVSLDVGMATDDVLSVAHEIRSELPATLGQHPLTQAWAYHYRTYANCVRGHADQGRFSVNVWLTPNEFHIGDPKRGGLVLLEKEHITAGVDGSSRSLLFDTSAFGSERSIVPYKFNRAIIFDAMTIHETDEFQFSSEYEGRRINMTYLFGWPAN